MDINKKREQTNMRNKVLQLLEPVFVVLTVCAFALPIMAVLNLSPITKTYSDVLGTNTGKLLKIDLVEDKNSVAFGSYVESVSDNSFRITSNIEAITSGQINFKSFSLKNTSDNEIKLYVSGSLESSSATEMGFISEGGKQILQTQDTTLFTKEVYLPAGESKVFELYLNSKTGTNFTDKLSINVSAIPQE